MTCVSGGGSIDVSGFLDCALEIVSGNVNVLCICATKFDILEDVGVFFTCLVRFLKFDFFFERECFGVFSAFNICLSEIPNAFSNGEFIITFF